MGLTFLLKYWKLFAIAAILAGAYLAGYTRADNAWEARNGKALAEAKSDFDKRLAEAISSQQVERDRQRRIADEQLRESQARGEKYKRLWHRAADLPVPDCAVSGEWVRNVRSALSGGAEPADQASARSVGDDPK